MPPQNMAAGAAGIILPGYASQPRITTDGAGGAIVAWMYFAAAGCSNDGFRAQRFLPDGTGAWGPVGAQLTSANAFDALPRLRACR